MVFSRINADLAAIVIMSQGSINVTRFDFFAFFYAKTLGQHLVSWFQNIALTCSSFNIRIFLLVVQIEKLISIFSSYFNTADRLSQLYLQFVKVI